MAQKGPRVAQTRAAGNRRIAQSLSPEEQHLSTGNPSCCTAPPQDFHWSTFSFSESRTAFSFSGQKKKWFWSPPGRQKTNKTEKESLPAEGKSRFVKFLCRADMISALQNAGWQKSVYPQGVRPIRKRQSRQRLGCGPGRAGHISTNEKRILFRRGRVRICGAFPPAPSRMPRPTILQMRLEILPTHFCPKPIVGRQNL